MADLIPHFQAKPPPQPKFFHFNRSAKEFQDADLITFTDAKGKEIVVKDKYSRLTK